MKKLIVILLLVATACYAAVAVARSLSEAQRARAVAEANAAALRDTLTMYGDSLTATRSLMQTQGEIDQDSIAALAGSLGMAMHGRDQAIRALNSVRVEFQAYRAQVESSVVSEPPPQQNEPEGSRQATFQLEGPPIQGSLWVTYRPTPPWGLATNLTVTPFTTVYSIGCEGHNALVNLTTPRWVTATPERGTVTPDVCNPVQPVPIFSFTIPKAIWAVAGGIVGWVAANWWDDRYHRAVYVP